MTIIDKRRGGGAAADMAQQVVQRAIDTNVPNHVKTGVSVTGVTISTGPVTVAHKLGRQPVGWHVLRAVGVAGASDASDVNETRSDDKTITFQRSVVTGQITYDFWIF
jgi:hypothetical protein